MIRLTKISKNPRILHKIWKRLVVHRDVHLRTDHLRRLHCILRPHRVNISDWKQREIHMIIPKKLKILHECCITGMIDFRSIDIEQKTRGRCTIAEETIFAPHADAMSAVSPT